MSPEGCFRPLTSAIPFPSPNRTLQLLDHPQYCDVATRALQRAQCRRMQGSGGGAAASQTAPQGAPFLATVRILCIQKKRKYFFLFSPAIPATIMYPGRGWGEALYLASLLNSSQPSRCLRTALYMMQGADSVASFARFSRDWPASSTEYCPCHVLKQKYLKVSASTLFPNQAFGLKPIDPFPLCYCLNSNKGAI